MQSGKSEMQECWLARTEMLVGKNGLAKLAGARVALVGLGGVGGAAAEALVRAGVGHLLFIDNDIISVTNINRQLLATGKSVGVAKTQVCKERALSINPAADIHCENTFILPGEDGGIFAFEPDYIIDAIDTITAKLFLIEEAKKRNVPLISCMGTGGRLSPFGFKTAKIEDTAGSACPVARVLRKELKKRGIAGVQVLYNPEPPLGKAVVVQGARHAPGSISYVPPVAGFMAAGFVVQQLLAM